MAGNTINANLNVTDQGGTVKQRTRETDKLGDSLTAAELAAKKLAKSNKAAAKFESQDYGASRALGTGTGASGRDFAKEAAGLGGLVRLYATYAANVFAVSAAFTALKNAADTTMMVQGLDKLGATSGLALGGMAKQFALASDGAISMREAMEATAKATSAGLSKDQLMDLGKVAKGASQALGVGMSDAVSRLTRGITKLEPELLDELGIFTKVGKATADYAKSVNKSVDSLTDFEKRQAFANAVLKEGKDKFGELAEAANPYDKLLASLSNVAQKILEIINVGIKPIASLFAENSGLIAAAIGLIGAKIIKQALPALTSWRAGLKDAATEAAKRSSEINTAFGENIVSRVTQQYDVPKLEKDLKRANTTYDRAVKSFITSDANYKGKSSILEDLKAGRELTAQQIKTLSADITKRTNEGSEANLRHAKSAQMIVDQYKKRLEVTTKINAAEEELHKPMQLGSGEWQRTTIAKAERAKAASLNLISGVGNKVELEGLRQGLMSFYKEVDSSKNLGRWDNLRTKAVGTFAGIATATSIALQALGPYMWILEALGAAYFLFSSKLSNNEKQVKAFSESIDALGESTKTAVNVAEKYKDILSTDSINAYANAVNTLSQDITKTVEALDKADAKANWFDRAIDNIKVIWGGNLRSQFTKNVTEGLESSIGAVPDGPLRDSLRKKLEASLGNVDLEKGFDALPTEKLVGKGREIAAILAETNKVVKNAQLVTQNVKETGKAAGEAYLAFSNAVFAPTQLQTYLSSSTKNILALRDAFKDSIAAPAEFKNIIDGITKLEFASPEAAKELTAIAEKYTDIQAEIDKTRQKLAEAKAQIRALDEKTTFASGDEYMKVQREREGLMKSLPALSQAITDSIIKGGTKLAELGKLAGEALAKETSSKIDQVFKETQLRINAINIAAKQSALAALPIKTEVSVKEEGRLALQALVVETELRKSNENLVNAVDLLRVEMEISRAQKEQERIGSGRWSSEDKRQEAIAAAQAPIDKLIAKSNAMKTGDVETLRKMAGDSPELVGTIQRMQNAAVINAQANQKANEIKMNSALKLVDVRSEVARKALESQIADLNAGLKDVTLTPAEQALKSAETNKKIEDLNTQIRALDQKTLEQKTDIAKTSGADPASVRSALERIKLEGERTAATAKTAAEEKQIELNVTAQVEALKEINEIAKNNLDIENNRKIQSLDVQKQDNDYAKTKLAQQYEYNAISASEYAQKNYGLSIVDAEIEKAKALLEIEKARRLELADLSVKIAERGGVTNAALESERMRIEANAETARKANQSVFEDKKRIAEWEKDNSTTQAKRAQDYANAFKSGIDSLTDAFVNFAKTGQISFKDLANAVIADIARIEIRLMLMKQVESSGGFLNLAKSFLGMNTGAPTGAGSASGGATLIDTNTTASLPVFAAMGAAYDSGIRKFAKGGTFTNSLVTSPTMFKFAQGTGLMGEAGPEAIMPLKRDSDGNLGVRASQPQGNVEVVVNNYSNAQATTKETKDAKGNRKIEVVIGEVVAQEMGRAGSSVQQSMLNNYGSRPATARR